MTLKTRLSAVEKILAIKNGEYDIKLLVRAEGESDQEAKKRAGLTDYPGTVLFVTEADLQLL